MQCALPPPRLWRHVSTSTKAPISSPPKPRVKLAVDDATGVPVAQVASAAGTPHACWRPKPQNHHRQLSSAFAACAEGHSGARSLLEQAWVLRHPLQPQGADPGQPHRFKVDRRFGPASSGATVLTGEVFRRAVSSRWGCWAPADDVARQEVGVRVLGGVPLAQHGPAFVLGRALADVRPDAPVSPTAARLAGVTQKSNVAIALGGHEYMSALTLWSASGRRLTRRADPWREA